MWSSRLFWRLFLTYASVTIVASVVFVVIFLKWQQEAVEVEVRQRMQDEAEVLLHIADPSWVASEVPLEELRATWQPKLEALGREVGTRLTLVLADGIVLADSATDARRLENHRDRPEILEAASVGVGFSTRGSRSVGEPFEYCAVRVGSREAPRGFVRVALPWTPFESRLQATARLVWSTAVVVLVCTLALTYWLAWRLVHPLETLTQAAQAIEAGNLGQEVLVASRDEIGMLAGAFNRMSRELASRVDQLQVKTRQSSEQSELLETVLGSMIEGVVVIDAQQRILYANVAAGPLLDLPATQAVGRSLFEAARHPRVQKVIEQALLGEQPERIEYAVPRTNAIVALIALPLPGQPTPGAVLVLHDVSELRRLENLRSEFVSNVSHELKTPLTTIQAYTETLLDGAIDDAAHNRQFLQRIDEQAERLHRLILDLLSLARIEAAEEAFELQPVSIDEAVRLCVAEHQAVADSKGISLVSQPAADKVVVWGDEEGLRTVLNNLVDNAIKYTPAAGRVSIRWHVDGRRAVIEVEDTGIGIPKQHQLRIFERFYRVDKARSRELGGTGLGLSIVKHWVQVFAGSVEVASETGRGSTFTIRLPMVGSLL
ncbi:MAG: HAMP domain-containing protein [Planctomycetes bacterium]|nr:HAMP domain-containing protein [Planctomycetota bacterium]